MSITAIVLTSHCPRCGTPVPYERSEEGRCPIVGCPCGNLMFSWCVCNRCDGEMQAEMELEQRDAELCNA